MSFLPKEQWLFIDSGLDPAHLYDAVYHAAQMECRSAWSVSLSNCAHLHLLSDSRQCS